MINTKMNLTVHGHVKAIDADTLEVLIDADNAIHPQNIARIIARGLAHEPSSWIDSMQLGNGGTHIDASLNISYLLPNITGTSAQLYKSTYSEVIDSSSISVGPGNSVISAASPSPAITSIVTCVMNLDANEPAGQAVSDNITTNPDSLYTFDELGLFSNEVPPRLLTHLIFSPIEKTANRSIIITYTLTISVS
jgi:hypothetical protein